MDRVTGYVLHTVEEYLQKDMAKQCFHAECQSYSRAAAKELYFRLVNSHEPPLIVLERFRDTMNRYAAVNPATQEIFSTASATAEYIIGCLI